MSARQWAAFATTLLLLLAGGPAAWAQNPAGAEASIPVPTPTAPVWVDGVVLFEVRGVSAFPAEVRAARRAAMIVEAAADPKVDPTKLEIVETEHGQEIVGGGRLVSPVFEADARLEGLNSYELALAQRQAIKGAILRYREARSPVNLGTAAVNALAATAIFALLIALLLPLFHRVDRLVQQRFRRTAEELEEKSFEILHADRLRGLLRGALRSFRLALVAVLAYSYLSYTLGLFPWTRFVAVRLTGWIVSPLATMGRAVLADIPDIIFLAILALVVRYGLRLLRLFFDGIDRGSIRFEGFEAEWAWPHLQDRPGGGHRLRRGGGLPLHPGLRHPRPSRGCRSSPASSSPSGRRRRSRTSSPGTR